MNKNQSEIFCENLNFKTIENNDYRKVAYTGKYMQFVYMCIKPGDNIHLETHNKTDQFVRIEQGEGLAIINKKEYKLYDDIGVIIPAGAKHEIVNTSTNNDLKLYTIYSPPNHDEHKIDVKNPNKQSGGSDYFKNKYLKYKKKYLQLQNKFL